MARWSQVSAELIGRDPIRSVLWGLLGLLVVHALFVLLAGLNQTFLFYYEFRQTQTALSTYWLAQGGDWLFHETPLFGSPWQLPLEFPLFQWIVAALHSLTGAPLDPLGRLVSFVFYLATLWPIYVFSRYWAKDRDFFLVLSCLFLACPLYLFWGRTFLIESTALFFSAVWLAYLAAALETRRLSHFVICTGAGALAMLVKVTTFPGFVLAGGLLVLIDLLRSSSFAAWRLEKDGTRLLHITRIYGPFLLPVFIPLVIYLPWMIASDAIKAASELTERYTSENTRDWIFGSMDLRMSGRLWLDTILDRSIFNTLGWSFVLVLPAAIYLLFRRTDPSRWLGACLLFLAPFLIFSNVHAVHPYYQVANAIFLLAAVAFILLKLSERVSPKAFICLLLVIIGLQLSQFYNEDYKRVVRDVTPNKNLGRTLKVAEYIKEATDPESGLMIFGYHYSAELPYYSQRRAVMVEFRNDVEQLKRLTSTPQTYFAGIQIGAYVICEPRSWDGRWRADQQAIIDRFAESLRAVMTPMTVSGCDIYLPASTEG